MSDKSIKINLYLLERNDNPHPEECKKCVIAAATEAWARELANQQSGVEGYVWGNENDVAITVIGEADDGIDGLICLSQEKTGWQSGLAPYPEKAARVYLLERNDTPQPDEWTKCVVAASNENGARTVANEQSKSEGYIWSDGRLVTATTLGKGINGVDGVICFSREKDS
jgi:hypothetical protein